ncbi:unnamed protein product [Danaus chrysippus]|uniref:(African queen) hypothetical protein n=1 Tax=Danaus chrysippus TaxID=151541 RepID=A0A8J2QA21_9NEOP|nr:unnamed protein product [Danaus chrysippus]
MLPPRGAATLSWWGGLRPPMISKAISAGSAIPVRLGRAQWTGPKEEVSRKTERLVGSALPPTGGASGLSTRYLLLGGDRGSWLHRLDYEAGDLNKNRHQIQVMECRKQKNRKPLDVGGPSSGGREQGDERPSSGEENEQVPMAPEQVETVSVGR